MLCTVACLAISLAHTKFHVCCSRVRSLCVGNCHIVQNWYVQGILWLQRETWKAFLGGRMGWCHVHNGCKDLTANYINFGVHPARGDSNDWSKASSFRTETSFSAIGPSRHRNQLQGYVNPELLHQWHLWKDCQWDILFGSLHQEAHSDIQRDSDSSQAGPAWRVGQARRLWRHQGRHQVHFLSEFAISHNTWWS